MKIGKLTEWTLYTDEGKLIAIVKSSQQDAIKLALVDEMLETLTQLSEADPFLTVGHFREHISKIDIDKLIALAKGESIFSQETDQ